MCIYICMFRSLHVNMKYSLYKATCEQVAVFQSFLSKYSSDLMPERQSLLHYTKVFYTKVFRIQTYLKP